jgi:hypothetical protein
VTVITLRPPVGFDTRLELSLKDAWREHYRRRRETKLTAAPAVKASLRKTQSILDQLPGVGVNPGSQQREAT